ncbi:MAG: zinc-ribbon domain-containing protein [Polyangiaceae bacterium]
MADRKPRRRPRIAAPETKAGADDAERSLGRAVALGLPLVAFVGAIGVGSVAGLGSALLVLASGALLGCIALLWASVRTLSGDAPLTSGLEGVVVENLGVDALVEEKRRVLRALKDLEAEHAIGKIDDADYGVIVERYRQDAKELMRQIDLGVGPLRDEAERIAREYLQRRRVPAAAPSEPAADVRSECASCGTSNEPDAAFCKKCGASMKPVAPGDTSDATS